MCWAAGIMFCSANNLKLKDVLLDGTCAVFESNLLINYFKCEKWLLVTKISTFARFLENQSNEC